MDCSDQKIYLHVTNVLLKNDVPHQTLKTKLMPATVYGTDV